MAAKPETNYIGRVHKALSDVYHEKNHNTYRGGTADCWYSGDAGDLWVEYKYVPKLPKRTEFLIPDLSALQARWLGNRLDEGRNVAVILGTPKGGVIFRDREWLVGVSLAKLPERLLSVKQVAEWIKSQTGNSRCYSLH